MKFAEVDAMWTMGQKGISGIIAVMFFVVLMLGSGASWGAATPMPEFQLPGVGDSRPTVKSEDFRGKVLLVNFWATWCPPCRQEIPSLVRLQEENRGRNFTVIGISMDKSGEEKVAQFAKKIGVNYPIALGNNAIAKSFGAAGTIPSTILVDASGMIIKRYPGYTTYEKMSEDVKKLLQ